MSTSAVDGATQNVINGLDEILCANDQILTGIGDRLEQACCDCSSCCDKDTQKVRVKIIKKINKTIVDISNTVEYFITKILNVIVSEINVTEWLLQQICVKCNWCKVGEPITVVIENNVDCKPQIEWLGQLVLSIKEGIPHLDKIISCLCELVEVQKEIRNRMPVDVFEEKFELKADEKIPPEIAPVDSGILDESKMSKSTKGI